jgi:hypothetical protein
MVEESENYEALAIDKNSDFYMTSYMEGLIRF